MRTSFYTLIAIFGNFCNLNAQMNSNFNAGSTHWNASGNSVETNPETVYGGSVAANRVAEVDFLVGLTQNITGLTVGQSYTLSYRASRRSGAATPNPVNVNVTIDGGALTTTDIRSNTTFAWTNSSFTFVATQTSHLLSITAGNLNVTTRGFIIDDIVITPISPLPVVFSSLTLTYESNGVHVNWSTASERNSDYFSVERSEDGKNWYSIASVKASGNSQETKFYDYWDYNLESNRLYYYRIVEFDLDSKETISMIESIFTKEASKFNAYPNPTQGKVFVSLNAVENISISNVFGQKVAYSVRAIGNETFEIDLSQNEKGIYFINNERISLE